MNTMNEATGQENAWVNATGQGRGRVPASAGGACPKPSFSRNSEGGMATNNCCSFLVSSAAICCAVKSSDIGRHHRWQTVSARRCVSRRRRGVPMVRLSSASSSSSSLPSPVSDSLLEPELSLELARSRGVPLGVAATFRSVSQKAKAKAEKSEALGQWTFSAAGGRGGDNGLGRARRRGGAVGETVVMVRRQRRQLLLLM